MGRKLAIVVVAVGVQLIAEDGSRQKIQVTKTDHIEFPSGGVLRFRNSIGELTVQGWDQPDLEITTTKSTKREYGAREQENHSELDKVRVVTERHGGEVVVITDFPRHRGFPPPSPVKGAITFNLEYNVKVPRNARIVVDHDVGEVNLEDVSGDVQITALQGTITLRLPEKVEYAIDAKSDWGSVSSDFSGRERRRPWLIGHQSMRTGPNPSQHLFLRIGYGDILILRERRPPPPAPLGQ